MQLIDATQWYTPLRKNLGKKNCELSAGDIERICRTFLDFQETEHSKIFPNQAFGYWKIRVERPLRLYAQLTRKAILALQFASGDEAVRSELYDRFGEALTEDFPGIRAELEKVINAWGESDEEDESGAPPKGAIAERSKKKLLDPNTWQRDARLVDVAMQLREELGEALFEDYNVFTERFDAALKRLDIRLGAPDKKAILQAVSWRDENAPPVIKKVHKPGKAEPDPLYGRFAATVDGRPCVVEYEPDSELRDSEQIPLLEEGGIEAFFEREVLPYVPDAWIDPSATRIGYEISFTRYFYQPPKLRELDEIRAEIEALEQQTDGLLQQILNLGQGG